MRILVTVAHYWKPPPRWELMAERLGWRKLPHYGSTRPDAKARIAALTQTIANLHTLFVRPQALAGERPATANGSRTAELQVIVCTDGKHHVLDSLGLPENFFVQRASACDSKYLSFECQDVLREHLGRYDYYCYMEDDLALHDPWFFEKLGWFRSQFGEEALLQPNRYELLYTAPVRKMYIDPVLAMGSTSAYQDIRVDPLLTAPYLGGTVAFERCINPHSGCYFLSAAQMEQWTRQPYFGERERCFVGPLESGATLGIMRTFKVYKPAIADASFLEIEHPGDVYMRRFVTRWKL